MSVEIDLGHDHTLRFSSWSPDRELNPHYEGIPDDPKIAAVISHKKPDGSDCSGVVTFDTQTAQMLNMEPRWRVDSWEPLTISPSVLCKTCGDHGFIRNGKWEPT